jgi:hypothetical protein
MGLAVQQLVGEERRTTVRGEGQSFQMVTGEHTIGHTGTGGALTRGVRDYRMAGREISGERGPKTGMAQEPNAVEQAVSRAIRDNLERIQRSADELHQAVNDVVSACASSKPANALPPMLRAQTSAAGLSAALEVLSRFITISLQPGPRGAIEEKITQLMGAAIGEPRQAPARPESKLSTPMVAEPAAVPQAAPVELEYELEAEAAADEIAEPLAAAAADAAEPEFEGEFDVNRLSVEEQELHRRANRVAKVSMQDIKMLRPEQVRIGREKKDLCIRLKDDIEKAHREYDRRFKPIMDHPVDYFYRWMVEILGEGDASALGEYPYAAPARHR